MALQFRWRPNNSPVSASTHRVNIGLEIGGDNSSIATGSGGTAGRVRLIEVQASSAAHRGSHEASGERQIAAFHGKFHRDSSASPANRITFEIELGNSTFAAHAGEVPGYDPECILGVDAFVLTFVNREFQIFLPFFLDTRSEGRFTEIQAVAETGSGQSANVIARSAVLNLRIRRPNRRVQTTSRIGSTAMDYTGDVIGNCILHHEQYILQGAYKNRSSQWPQQLQASLIPLPWTGTFAVPFQNYSSGSMRIVLMNDLLDPLLPDASYLQTNVSGVSNGQTARRNVETRSRNQIQSTLRTIFTDAGFTNPNVWWENDQQATQVVGQFRARFQRSSGRWQLRQSSQPLSIPFWTYFVVYDDSIRPAVGHAENQNISHTTTQAQTGQREYLLPYPAPLGSGDKQITDAIKIRTSYFLPRITETTSSSGYATARQYSSVNDFNTAVDSMADKVAITIAHEIGHALGLMHDILIGTSTPYSESGATPVLSIMSSGIDTGAFGRDTKFSHQAKVIWHRAFGVTPVWTNTYLQNKTWGNNWDTVDWSQRKRRFFRLHGEDSMSYPGLLHSFSTPPNAGTGSSVQRGTYVP